LNFKCKLKKTTLKSNWTILKVHSKRMIMLKTMEMERSLKIKITLMAIMTRLGSIGRSPSKELKRENGSQSR